MTNRRINESLQSLQVYATLISAGGPMTAREIMAKTGVADGTLYPILEKRIAAGIIVEVRNGRPASYELTPEGYEVVKAALLSLEVTTSSWLHCERRYNPMLG